MRFEGFGGVALAAESFGIADDPGVLVLQDANADRSTWRDAAVALAEAGRHVIALDLRGTGASGAAPDGRYDLDAHVADVRAVLAALGSRPVIVGEGAGAEIAVAAIGEAEAQLATGLVLAGGSLPSPRLAAAAEGVRVPVLAIVDEGAMPPVFADGEAIALGASDAPGGELFNTVLLDFLERRVPQSPPEYRAGSDPRTLRDALGCFATGVTVVTTRDGEGQPVGLTANSFTSVSLDPPLLLVCLAKSVSSFEAFAAAAHFAVNVLHIGQQPVSARFARRGEDRFADTPIETWDTGVPILAHALASFECAREAVHDAGDHVILVGRVGRVRFEPRRDPLLYFRGRYRRLHFS